MTSPLELPTGAVVTLAPPQIPTVETAPPNPASFVLLPSPGARGPAGQAGDNSPVFGQTPTGAIDGVNTVFTLPAFRTGSTRVYLNGLRETHYTETSPTQITFEDPPQTGDTITVDYILN